MNRTVLYQLRVVPKGLSDDYQKFYYFSASADAKAYAVGRFPDEGFNIYLRRFVAPMRAYRVKGKVTTESEGDPR